MSNQFVKRTETFLSPDSRAQSNIKFALNLVHEHVLFLASALLVKWSLFSTLLISILCIQCQVSEEEKLLSTQIGDNLVINKSKLNLRPLEGLVYYKDKPFTGVSVQYFNPKQLSVSIQYVNGKKEGLYQKWYPNGQLGFESNYVNGRQEGLTKSWWKNKVLRSESNFKNGIANGEQLQWYKSGAKFKRINVINGKEEGIQQAWRENGKIYNNYEAKNGRIFGLKRANLCYQLADETVQFSD